MHHVLHQGAGRLNIGALVTLLPFGCGPLLSRLPGYAGPICIRTPDIGPGWVKRRPRPLDHVERSFIEADFKLVSRREELPAEIVAYIAPVANPGEDYNFSDLIEPGSVRRRLVFGGTSKKVAFVLFDQGGFAHGWQTVCRVRSMETHVPADE